MTRAEINEILQTLTETRILLWHAQENQCSHLEVQSMCFYNRRAVEEVINKLMYAEWDGDADA
jgi:hypothetical protein